MHDLGERSIAEIFQQRKLIPPVQPLDEDLQPAQAAFLRYLSLALCLQTGVSQSEAESNARWLYADAQNAYVTNGGTIYGSSHAGLMRWIAERLNAVPPVGNIDPLST